MAFYKNDNGILLWSLDRVINDNFQLWEAEKDTYTYPVEGWIWADSEYSARMTLNCFGIQPAPSWILNTQTAQWDPPIAYPSDDKNYRWNEDSLNWIEIPN